MKKVQCIHGCKANTENNTDTIDLHAIAAFPVKWIVLVSAQLSACLGQCTAVIDSALYGHAIQPGIRMVLRPYSRTGYRAISKRTESPFAKIFLRFYMCYFPCWPYNHLWTWSFFSQNTIKRTKCWMLHPCNEAPNDAIFTQFDTSVDRTYVMTSATLFAIGWRVGTLRLYSIYPFPMTSMVGLTTGKHMTCCRGL